MSQPNTTLYDDQNQQVMKATWKFVENITPWLLEVGSWIFGGLIALNLILIEALLAIGPVDRAVLAATTAFALALPLDVAGLVLLRLLRDLDHFSFESDFENEVRQIIQSTSPALEGPAASPKTVEGGRKRRTWIALFYSLGILTLCVLLTLAGIIAALWHMATWIAVAFALMVLISLVIVVIAVLTSQPFESPEEKERYRRYGQELARQAREQAGQDREGV